MILVRLYRTRSTLHLREQLEQPNGIPSVCSWKQYGTSELPFVLQNECGVPDKSVATVRCHCMCSVNGLIYLNRQAVIFDEDEQTAQDYSIVITKPPSDAIDPEEWRYFFAEQRDGALE